MEFTLSLHAREEVAKRRIALEWIERVLAAPRWLDLDADDSSVKLALSPIEEMGGRVLCVVYNWQKQPPHVVTVFFDRRMRDRS